ncbi:hypothetical protein ASA1KI_06440 [Opitutales bacterium ASA1]|uniref:hypothetical protein n=1 Tax=Congregicoccus parvus TaxID=3081749 RepID=UPI002B317BAF|nr:hypothetical protein ASA1KI_06440 [Opitutales bacterium ASA1]
MTTPAVSSQTGSNHRWRFYRVGGLDLVRIETAEDLLNLDQLDQKLWTALACPVKGLEFDEKTLALIDTDGDGRVRAPEVVAAVKWAGSALTDPALLIKGGESLPVAALKDPALVATVREILAGLGKSDSATVSLADVGNTAAIFAATKFNGDGVVTAESAGSDATTASLVGEIVATQGGATDRSGKPGVDAGKLGAFYGELAAFDAWTKQAEADKAGILPLGDATGAGLAALEAVRTKIDDFFGRCRLAAFDARAIAALNRQESEFLELAAKDLSVTADEISNFPLARVEASKALPLVEGVNPAWVAAVDAFRTAVVAPLFGADKTSLTESEWAQLKGKFTAYKAWSGSKAGASVASLGIERVRAILAGDGRAKIDALIVEDLKLAPQFTGIATVEKLLRFNRDLVRLLHNFVAFTDFYSPDKLAVFQAGTLYLDSRSCELVVRVADGGKHAAMAGLSKAYLAYCNCTRPATGETMEIAAAFTNGDSDHLMVGRNGIFYDRKGRDWDATITKVIDNPISIRQAFWAPYKKFVRMLEEQAAKRAAAAEAASDAKMANAASATANADKAAKPEPKKFDVGTIAALGVAVSGIVAVLTAIIGGILGLTWWQIPLAVIGVLLAISGPSMIIAALKLRQRNLGPILDANGWAVNGRVKINIPFGTSLTDIAHLPAGAQRTLDDPFGEKKTPWGLYLFLLALVAAAVWVRWDHNKKGGYYFWQEKPAAEVPAVPGVPAEGEAPAAVAPAS